MAKTDRIDARLIAEYGATMRPDKDANRELYGANETNEQILTGKTKSPEAAAKMEALLSDHVWSIGELIGLLDRPNEVAT